MARFKDRFKELVEHSEWESTEIYEKLNISRFKYYNWQNGRGEPDTETLKKIAKLFDVSLDWLLGASDIRKHDVDPNEGLPEEAIKQLNEYRELLRMKYLQKNK